MNLNRSNANNGPSLVLDAEFKLALVPPFLPLAGSTQPLWKGRRRAYDVRPIIVAVHVKTRVW